MKIIFLLLAISFTVASTKSLQIKEDGTFVILQLTDMHLCHEDQDIQMQDVMRTMIKASKPDLVMVTGDLVSGYCYAELNEDEGFFERRWRRFIKPIEESDVLYAYTLGNHDPEGDLTPLEIMKLDTSHPNSLSKIANLSNPATYTLPVYSYSSPSPDQPAANLWVFDSGDYKCNGKADRYGCIEKDQIEWYNQESKKFKETYGDKVLHLAFFHIPIPEYKDVLAKGPRLGTAGEEPCSSNQNSGFFDAVKRNKDISAMFVGHDHNNDYRGYLDGIELIYGRKVGIEQYGPLADVKTGGRVLTIKEKKNSDGTTKVTWEDKIVTFDGNFEVDKPFKNRMIPDPDEFNYKILIIVAFILISVSVALYFSRHYLKKCFGKKDKLMEEIKTEDTSV